MEDNSNLIIKYLEGDCSPDERVEVERLKREDDSFAEELKWYQLAYTSIEVGAQERRRNELKELAAMDKPQGRIISMTNNQKYWYAIAAAIALILMVYVFIEPRSQTNNISSQDLWAFTGPIEVNAAVRGENLSDSAELALHLDSLLVSATSLHQNGACEEAAALWLEIAEKTNIDEYRLSTIICYLNTQNPAQALEVVKQVENIQAQKGEDAESIDDQISWYKIIAYIQQYEKGEDVAENLKNALLHYQEAGYFQHQESVKELVNKL